MVQAVSRKDNCLSAIPPSSKNFNNKLPAAIKDVIQLMKRGYAVAELDQPTLHPLPVG